MSAVPSVVPETVAAAPSVAQAPATPDHNRTGVDYRRPMPRPKVRGPVIDVHSHLHAVRHGNAWFEAADHYGIDRFLTMTPLEEAIGLQRDWPERLHFIAIPRWGEWGEGFIDHWRSRIEAFYNIGSRIVKFWFAPPAIGERKWRLDSEMFRPLLREAADRGMAIMTHIGDPEIWYQTKYTDTAKYGTRDDHYQMWENVLAEYSPRVPWIGATSAATPRTSSACKPCWINIPGCGSIAAPRAGSCGKCQRAATKRGIFSSATRTASSLDPIRSAPMGASLISSPAGSGCSAGSGNRPASSPARFATQTWPRTSSPCCADWRCPMTCCKSCITTTLPRFCKRWARGHSLPSRNEWKSRSAK